VRRFKAPPSTSPRSPLSKKNSRTRNVHASTAIEGNPLTLAEVKALEEGREITAQNPRSKREVTNYFAGLRYLEKKATLKTIRHDHLFELHRILASGDVMDQGEAGCYRSINVRVGKHFPPTHQDVSALMFELLIWWNEEAPKLSPILSSAILHYRFEDIHPFADGNGREIYEIDVETGKEGNIATFSTPDKLRQRTFGTQNDWRDRFSTVPFEDRVSSHRAIIHSQNFDK